MFLPIKRRRHENEINNGIGIFEFKGTHAALQRHANVAPRRRRKRGRGPASSVFSVVRIRDADARHVFAHFGVFRYFGFLVFGEKDKIDDGFVVVDADDVDNKGDAFQTRFSSVFRHNDKIVRGFRLVVERLLKNDVAGNCVDIEDAFHVRLVSPFDGVRHASVVAFVRVVGGDGEDVTADADVFPDADRILGSREFRISVVDVLDINVDEEFGSASGRSAVEGDDLQVVRRPSLSIQILGHDQIQEKLIVRSALDVQRKCAADVTFWRRSRSGGGRGREGRGRGVVVEEIEEGRLWRRSMRGGGGGREGRGREGVVVEEVEDAKEEWDKKWRRKMNY